MIKSKISDLKIKAIKPVAYLNDLGGLKLIVEVPQIKDNNRFSFLSPPEYAVEQLISEELVAAAISKYYYVPLEESILIRTGKELKGFIKKVD